MEHHHHEEDQSQTELKSPSHAHDNMNPPMGYAGHGHHAMMISDFKKRFYLVLVLTIPFMMLSEMIQHWLNIHLEFPGSKYVLFGLSTIVLIYGGFPFLKGWMEEIREWKPGMGFNLFYH